VKPTAELVTRIKRKHPKIPIIGFPRESGIHYKTYAEKSGIDVLGIDQNVSLDVARDQLQKIKLLQGNLDPALLVAGGMDMRRGIEAIIDKMGPRHIFNLGHGVVPHTPPEHVAELIKIVRERTGP